MPHTKHPELHNQYQRGMDALFVSAPTFADFALRLGKPVPTQIDSRAYVSWNPRDKQIDFHLDPEYLATLSDEEVGAVIAHETYHVLFNHFADQLDPAFPNAEILNVAHECIINDGLQTNVGLTLPDDVIFGEPLFQHSFAYDSTKMAYEFIENYLKQQEQDENNSEKEENSSSGNFSNSQTETSSDQQEQSCDKQEEEFEKNSETRNTAENTSKQSDEMPSPSTETSSEQEEEESIDFNNINQTKNSDSKENFSDRQETPQDGQETNSSDQTADKNGQNTDSNGQENKDENSSLPKSNSCHGIVIPKGSANKDISDHVAAVIAAVPPSGIDNSLDDLIDTVVESFPELVNTVGQSLQGGANIALTPSTGYSLNWETFLKKINPRVGSSHQARTKPNWSRPPRRLSAFYPKTILPTPAKVRVQESKGDELATLLIFVDVSGSIPNWIPAKALEMSLTVPKHLINTRLFTFNNLLTEIDKNKDYPLANIYIGGGTNFDILVEKAVKVEKDLGKEVYVLVITDLEGELYDFASHKQMPKLADRWYWMTIPDSNSWRPISYNKSYWKKYSPTDHFYELEEFSNILD